MIQELKIEAVRTDGGTQVRVLTDPAVVDDYVEIIEGGTELPDLVVFLDDSGIYWLSDGFHRLAAYRRLKRTTVSCEIRNGNVKDAILYGIEANQKHGLRFTNSDKRKSVEVILGFVEYHSKSATDIAKICSVSDSLVKKVKSEMGISSFKGRPKSSEKDQKEKFDQIESIKSQLRDPVMGKQSDGEIANSLNADVNEVARQRQKLEEAKGSGEHLTDSLRKQLVGNPLLDNEPEMKKLAEMPLRQQKQIIKRIVEHGEGETVSDIEKIDRAAERAKKAPVKTPIYAEGNNKYQIVVISPDYTNDLHVENMAGLDIRNLAERDAFVFLWAQWDNISKAISWLKGWGCSYRGMAVMTVESGDYDNEVFDRCVYPLLFGKFGKGVESNFITSPILEGSKDSLLDPLSEGFEEESKVGVLFSEDRNGWSFWTGDIFEGEKEKQTSASS